MVPAFQDAAFSLPVGKDFGAGEVAVRLAHHPSRRDASPPRRRRLPDRAAQIRDTLTQQAEQQQIPVFLEASARQGEHPGVRPALHRRVPAAVPAPPAASAAPAAWLRHPRRPSAQRPPATDPANPQQACCASSDSVRATLICSPSAAARRCARSAARPRSCAPPDLVLFLESEGVAIVRGLITDQPLFVRGSTEVIDGFVERLDGCDLALGDPRQPALGFRRPADALARARAARASRAEIVPGMPRATLSAAITMPLVPLPPGSSHQNWDDLVQIMARLRRSCPWDREQTHESLVRYLIEETYEVVDAIEGDDEGELCEELGDLLFQVVFHAQLGDRTRQVLDRRRRRRALEQDDPPPPARVRRHRGRERRRRVAELGSAQSARGVERVAHLEARRHSARMPRAAARQKMQEKAARVGFDWVDVRDITEKLAEELREFAEARVAAGPTRARGPARARRTRRRALHRGQPRAQAEHRRRGRDARRQREIRPPLPLHGALRAGAAAASSAT